MVDHARVLDGGVFGVADREIADAVLEGNQKSGHSAVAVREVRYDVWLPVQRRVVFGQSGCECPVSVEDEIYIYIYQDNLIAEEELAVPEFLMKAADSRNVE